MTEFSAARALRGFAIAPKRAAARGINESTKGQGARVLLVDDEDSVQQVLCGMLEFAGYEVLQAKDGEEAINEFRARGAEIDCVLLDLSMPKLDGDEAFSELKKLRSDVRVILSSGFTERQVLSRFEGEGLAGVIQKPARMHVLLEKIALALKSL
ncbi:MAG: two-component system cell cycle sensor histidine kinase/response regulator CckA [Planctomycetota bacterium]|jgi:two-component system cell cycle sensor histidine kinase/response regulator CckA